MAARVVGFEADFLSFEGRFNFGKVTRKALRGPKRAMIAPMNGKLGWLWAIVAAALLTVLFAWRSHPVTVGSEAFARQGDHIFYEPMARGDTTVKAPFRWRKGLAVTARAMPTDYQTAYRILTYLAMFGGAVAMFGLGRRLGGADKWGYAAMGFLFAVQPLSQAAIDNFWLIDVAALAFVVAITAAHLYELWPLVIVLSLLGGGVRETVPVLAAALCWFVRHSKTALYALVGVLTYAAIRISDPAVHKFSVADALSARIHTPPATMVMDYLVRPLSWPVLGLLALALVLKWPIPRERVLRLLPLIVLVVGQLLVASDTDRLLMMLTPGLVLLLIQSASGSPSPSPMGRGLGGGATRFVLALAAFGAAAALAHAPNVVWIVGVVALCVGAVVAERK